MVGSKDEKGSQQCTCPAAEARFKRPRVVVDGDGNCVISDANAHVVYLFHPAQGTVTVLAGSGEAGNADGAAASVNLPVVPAIDHNGSVSQNLLLNNGSIAFCPCSRTVTPYLFNLLQRYVFIPCVLKCRWLDVNSYLKCFALTLYAGHSV